MDGNSYLLDTNIVIDILNKADDFEDRLKAGTIFLSSTIIGELYFGAFKSQKVQENRSKIDELISAHAILDCDTQTALQYGQIKSQLRRKGRPIPENDIWIAAVAMQYQLTLITRDDHFNEIDSLNTVSWP